MGLLEAISIIVGVVAGVSGLVLGILNYRHQRDTTRPRILVRPRVWTLVDRDTKEVEDNVGVIEVCNVGLVPVIGSTVGVLPKRKGEKTHVFITPKSINGQEWTAVLEPGHVAMLRVQLDDLPDTKVLGRAYAKTIVGDTFKASKRDMRRFAEDRAAAARGE